MLSIVVKKDYVNICLLKGPCDVEHLQWLITSGQKSLLKDTRDASKMIRSHMPLLLVNMLIEFLEQRCNKYNWFQLRLREDGWAANFEEEGLIYYAVFDGTTLDWDLGQIIID